MERRSFLRNTGLAGVLAAGAAPAVVHAQANVRWRLASSFPKSLDSLYGGAETLAKKVADMTGGKFQISVHAAGELVPALGIVDALQNNTIEAGHTVAYYYFGKDDAWALGAGIPFGLNSRQMTAWMYDGNGLKLMREFYSNYNIINFPGGNTGAQMAGWFRKEIKSVNDLKGLKFRIGGFAGRVMERLGVVPQNLPAGEVYQALEKGTIDAAEFVGPYDDLRLGLYKVAPNYYYPGWWEGGPQVDFYISQKAYDSLSSEYKAVLEAAAALVHSEIQAKYDARNPEALKQLVAQKVKLVSFPKSVMDQGFKVCQDLYAELSAKNPAWKKIYGDLEKFRRDLYLWWRFNEAQYDRYMQGVKL
ncbi:TRAP transporter substrate-binding protein DctP [Caldimonas thermodepolymerans]|jgi:TRAP-type mannitol/chloroaromatic compound transport system substrate-binding protein|uniref:ABC transporter substrate-binding protein n=1 Tax=Caldimonas thermodepolymerans TaxID=215580 RepID=A0A2S5T2U4_9BURK|nr:TRAP transporter substrate-binding protein DctP [Caldimonas thermodepolymerans]PPE69208.1 ABC transporter substrate-binding protein [Caldimonas thermodepolymerans]QPC32886.1 TRAP transporter substrate-binding protein DctP [Caldimonas thermodepolymerans]RDI03664.1 secreted protein [Caldimonas thermodepolymerans]TCP09633.1 secreted protein [Caldimonas thermodepolymerans]UZG45756.1 TRAP transporter substrate-binding protein DctP [Caldimonas thermodepolymerans]